MERIRELDALRGLGAAAILCYHYWPNTFFFGWSRVDFFFVLSGYLTTTILIKTPSHQNSLMNFYAKRAGRICPAYYLLLLILVVFDTRRMEAVHTAALIHAASFTQYTPHYWSGKVPPYTLGPLDHTWSLALEQQFYLIWPLIIRMCGRRHLIMTAVWIAVDSVVVRAVGLHPWTLLARCDGLALGGVLAVALDENVRVGHRTTLFILALSCVAGLTYTVVYLTRPGIPKSFNLPLDFGASLAVLSVNLFYTGFIGLVICFSGHRAMLFLRFRALCYVGRFSYGIYLFSSSILLFIDSILGADSLWSKPVSVALTIAVAAASWELFECPLSKLILKLAQYGFRGGVTRGPRNGYNRPDPSGLSSARPPSASGFRGVDRL